MKYMYSENDDMWNDVQILKNAGYLIVIIMTRIPYFIYSS